MTSFLGRNRVGKNTTIKMPLGVTRSGASADRVKGWVVQKIERWVEP
ncbi:MAG: hypothetical protein WC617_16985 [Rhodanobacter sp.]|jgi:ABC-type uncharacterized transport system ATPase subunit